MAGYTWKIAFSEGPIQVHGTLELDQPADYTGSFAGSSACRTGRLLLEGGKPLDLVLYHNEATQKFIYLWQEQQPAELLKLVGLSEEEIARVKELTLPGQLCLGPARSDLAGEAIRDIFASPPMREVIACHAQENLAVYPIAREGLKYQIAEAIFRNYGYLCDEVVLDAHHVFDSSVPVYNRKVEMTLFKDKDLDQQQRDKIHVAFIGDSIASGLVMKAVIERVMERFGQIEQVDVISPLATVRGLCRVAQSALPRDTRVRVHVFETLLNALPPDYYYSAHFNIPEFHIRPDLEQEYRAWWGKDNPGRAIAETACAGYGWSEAFFSPRKQIQMINAELQARHGLTITDILRRTIS